MRVIASLLVLVGKGLALALVAGVALSLIVAVVLPLLMGSKGTMVVSIFWGHAIAWVFGGAGLMADLVDQAGVIERSGLFECDHIVVALQDGAQATPFAGPGDRFDWQVEQRGQAADGRVPMSVGDEVWAATPASDPEYLGWQIADCGVSAPVVEAIGQALSAPGSWVAFRTRGADQVYVYSQPQGLALIVTTER